MSSVAGSCSKPGNLPDTIPDTSTCIRLMEEYGMLDNIRRHSLVVARVADILVTGLSSDRPGVPAPDRSLVLAGSLLHDIAKTPCLDGRCDHARTGAEICRNHGFFEVACIVAEHVILADFDTGRYRKGMFTAREIVYYADKRVRHDQVVSLEERLDYILEHYGNDDPYRHRLIRKNFQRCVELEQALFSFLPLHPDDIEHRVRFPQPPQDNWNDPWS